MKNTLCAVCLILLSCNNINNDVQFKNKKEDNTLVDTTLSIADTTSKFADTLSTTLSPNNTLYVDSKIDSNLISQLDLYQKALLSGDVDLAFTFYYSGALENIREMFPNDNIDDNYIKENVIKMTYNMIKKWNETKDTDFEYIIGNIICRHQYNGTLLYVINTSLDATIEGKRRSVPSNIIGISNNKGLNWTFMAMDNEITRPILTKYFSRKTADEIMSCN